MKDDVFEMILKTGKENTSSQAVAEKSDFVLPKNWQEEHQDGQLAVDVAETDNQIIVVSTIAGAETDKIEVYLHNDLLTIRGIRLSPFDALVGEFNINHTECYWGKFSRTIVLPVDVKSGLAKAEYKNGILKIELQKKKIDAKIDVLVVEE